MPDPNNSVAGGDYVSPPAGCPDFRPSPTGAPPFNITAVRDDFHLGYYHYFHATLQREVLRNSSVTASYVGSRGRDLVSRVEHQRPACSGRRRAAQSTGCGPSSRNSAVPQHPGVHQRRPVVVRQPAVVVPAEPVARHQHPAQLHAVEVHATTSRRTAPCRRSRRPIRTIPRMTTGPCTFDVRHNFNFGGSYAVPGTPIGGQPVMVGAVFTALSGRPFTSGSGLDRQLWQVINAIRANCLVDPIYNYDLDYLFPDLNTSRSAITNGAQAFANPAAGTLGTCGRDSGRGPTFRQLDLNIVKEFKLQSGTRLQARWEIFNLTNHVNLGGFIAGGTSTS